MAFRRRRLSCGLSRPVAWLMEAWIRANPSLAPHLISAPMKPRNGDMQDNQHMDNTLSEQKCRIPQGFSVPGTPYNAGDICRKTGRILNSRSEYLNHSVKTG